MWDCLAPSEYSVRVHSGNDLHSRSSLRLSAVTTTLGSGFLNQRQGQFFTDQNGFTGMQSSLLELVPVYFCAIRVVEIDQPELSVARLGLRMKPTDLVVLL